MVIQRCRIENGYPVVGEVKTGGRVRPFNLPAVRAVTAVHTGPYEGLREVYPRMEQWMKDNGITPGHVVLGGPSE